MSFVIKPRNMQVLDKKTNRNVRKMHWDVGWVLPEADGYENSYYTEYKWQSMKICEKAEDAALLCNYLNGGAISDAVQTQIKELLQDLYKTTDD